MPSCNPARPTSGPLRQCVFFYDGNTPTELNVGQYFGQSIFGSYVSTESTALSGTTFAPAAAPATANGMFTTLISAYATGQSLAGSPQTLFQSTTQNGFPSLTIPPGLSATYLTQTFDFNVRANDVAIDVQSSPDLSTWTTLVTLEPAVFWHSGRAKPHGSRRPAGQPLCARRGGEQYLG